MVVTVERKEIFPWKGIIGLRVRDAGKEESV